MGLFQPFTETVDETSKNLDERFPLPIEIENNYLKLLGNTIAIASTKIFSI